MDNLTEFDIIRNKSTESVLNGRQFGEMEGRSFIYYGTEGQAARQAVPAEVPTREQEVEPEEIGRPMPSATIFEALDATPKRNRHAGIGRLLGYGLAIAVAFIGLYAVTALSGELNDWQVKNYRLKYELSSLESEERMLEYRVAKQISEKEIDDYAENVLGMIPESEAGSSTVNFSSGDSFEVGQRENDTENSVFAAAVMYVKNIISGVIDYIN